jgi:predicted RNA-binding protein with PIN domain
MTDSDPTEMRWLVDGMNVIGSRPDRWWRDRPGAMRRLVDALSAFARETGGEVTVVFDGRAPTPEPAAGGVEVLFARRRGPNAADDEIARLVADDADPGSLTVVTSDGDLAQRVRECGAGVEGAGGFRRRLDRASGS